MREKVVCWRLVVVRDDIQGVGQGRHLTLLLLAKLGWALTICVNVRI